MSSYAFDPYLTWLGISPQQRPVSHYDFLNLPEGESSQPAIQKSIDLRRSFFQSQLSGEYGGAARMMLEKLEEISDCMSDERAKKEYDKMLKASSMSSRSMRGQVAPGFLLGQYELLEKVDKAASGILWRVQNSVTGKKGLLKMLPSKSSEQPEVLKRFQREIQLASQLSHDNLLCACDADINGEIPYYVMSVERLTNLEQLCRSRGLLPLQTVISYMIQAAKGCEYLHWKGVVHRNLRPDNLFVDQLGILKVGNYLTARTENGSYIEGGFDEQLTQDGQMLGSFDYMAPEQASSANKADHRSDIYSLGCTMYWLLTGRPVYVETSLVKKLMAHQNAPIPSLRRVRSDIPDKLDKIFQKMMAKNPAQRFQSMAEIVSALSDQQPRGKKSEIPSWVWLSIGLGIVLLVMLLIVVNL